MWWENRPRDSCCVPPVPRAPDKASWANDKDNDKGQDKDKDKDKDKDQDKDKGKDNREDKDLWHDVEQRCAK